MVCYRAKEHATGLTVLEVFVLIDPLKKGTTSWKKKKKILQQDTMQVYFTIFNYFHVLFLSFCSSLLNY